MFPPLHQTTKTTPIIQFVNIIAEIQVSGTVVLSSRNDIVPSIQVQFVETFENSTCTATVHFEFTYWSGLIQHETYSVSIQNQRSYRVICVWDVFFGNYSLPLPNVNGTLDWGTLSVNCGLGVTSITKDYSG